MGFFFWSRHKKPASKQGSYGFQTPFCDPEDAVVDLVFLHGLTGDREKTWTAEKSSEPWPKSLLPSKIPNARILSYGYDANVVKLTKVVSSNGIGEHAKTLLSALAAVRDTDERTRNRPIVFVAHSLGGLVCQDALRSAALSGFAHHKQILDSTRGVVFMGTPLTGSGMAAAAERLARWLRAVKNTNSRILSVLRQDSEVADRIQSDFNSLLEKRAQEGRPKINVACFYEELPLGIVGQVVPKQAATHHPFEEIGVPSNHMDMVRFSDETDSGFVLLVSVLRRWIGSLPAQQEGQRAEGQRAGGRQQGGNELPNPILQARDQAEAEPEYSRVSVGGDVTGSNIAGGSITVHGPLTIGQAAQ